MADTMRDEFEAFHGCRQGKGAAYRNALFRRRDDDTYLNESVQRHWWTWQNSHEAGRQLGMSQANALWEMAKTSEAAMIATVVSRDGQRGIFVCDVQVGGTPAMGSTVYATPQPAAERVALSDEQVAEAVFGLYSGPNRDLIAEACFEKDLSIARLIERAHGIGTTEQAKEQGNA